MTVILREPISKYTRINTRHMATTIIQVSATIRVHNLKYSRLYTDEHHEVFDSEIRSTPSSDILVLMEDSDWNTKIAQYAYPYYTEEQRRSTGTTIRMERPSNKRVKQTSEYGTARDNRECAGKRRKRINVSVWITEEIVLLYLRDDMRSPRPKKDKRIQLWERSLYMPNKTKRNGTVRSHSRWADS